MTLINLPKEIVYEPVRNLYGTWPPLILVIPVQNTGGSFGGDDDHLMAAIFDVAIR